MLLWCEQTANFLIFLRWWWWKTKVKTLVWHIFEIWIFSKKNSKFIETFTAILYFWKSFFFFRLTFDLDEFASSPINSRNLNDIEQRDNPKSRMKNHQTDEQNLIWFFSFSSLLVRYTTGNSTTRKSLQSENSPRLPHFFDLSTFYFFFKSDDEMRKKKKSSRTISRNSHYVKVKVEKKKFPDQILN